MRFLSKKQVKALITLSFAQIDRLEAAGTFPKRIRLGQNRVCWIEDEVLEWMKRQISKRGKPTDAPISIPFEVIPPIAD